MLKKVKALFSKTDNPAVAESLPESATNETVKEDWFTRLKQGLKKTRTGIENSIIQLFRNQPKIDDDFIESLEEILIQSDLGIKATAKIIEHFKEIAAIEKVSEPERLMALIKDVLLVIMDEKVPDLKCTAKPLSVILVVGVNGVGKTTTIAKLSYKLKTEGKSVLLAAADTFRAGAIEQLEVWGRRVGAEVIKYQTGADAAAVVFDAIKAALARKIDVLIVDTAGRFHNKKNLMEELKKIRRIIQKEIPEAPHECLLVLDATCGQNAISQAKIFREELDISGIILTKLDGTARGGIIIAVKEELNIPVKFIGIGEKLDDLRKFNPNEFIEALFR